MINHITLDGNDIRKAIARYIATRFLSIIDPCNIEIEVQENDRTWCEGEVRAIVDLEISNEGP